MGCPFTLSCNTPPVAKPVSDHPKLEEKFIVGTPSPSTLSVLEVAIIWLLEIVLDTIKGPFVIPSVILLGPQLALVDRPKPVTSVEDTLTTEKV